MVGEKDGLGLGIIVVTLGGSVGDPLGAVDGYMDGLAVDGDTVGDVEGIVVGVVVGRVVTGGNVGDVVGNEVGKSVGLVVVGDDVGVEVMLHPYTSSLVIST